MLCSNCGIDKSPDNFSTCRPYCKRCKKCLAEYYKDYRKRQKRKWINYARNIQYSYREKLTDSYIKKAINGQIGKISFKNIPIELIILKRKQLQIKRLLKQQKS